MNDIIVRFLTGGVGILPSRGMPEREAGKAELAEAVEEIAERIRDFSAHVKWAPARVIRTRGEKRFFWRWSKATDQDTSAEEYILRELYEMTQCGYDPGYELDDPRPPRINPRVDPTRLPELKPAVERDMSELRW